jgi:hypothetical protein
MTFPHKRLSTDAMIKLRNAGFSVVELSGIKPANRNKPYALRVYRNGAECGDLQIVCGTVDNVRVEELLNVK